MKIFLALISILVSHGVNAAYAPQLGAEVISDVISATKSWQKKEVIEESYIEDDYFIVLTSEVLKKGAEVTLNREYVDGVDLRKKFISDIKQDCQLKSGVLEDLKTAVGAMRVCRLTSTYEKTSLDTWYAQDIPFGIVQMRYKDLEDSTQNFEIKIKSFKK